MCCNIHNFTKTNDVIGVSAAFSHNDAWFVCKQEHYLYPDTLVTLRSSSLSASSLSTTIV